MASGSADRDASGRTIRLRPLSAPAGGAVAICPHCWAVNVGAQRLCGRCGADMTLLLQESGGLRRTSPVQSPMPVRASHRLSPLARATLLALTALLATAWIVVPMLGARAPRTGAIRADAPAGHPGEGRHRAAGLPGTEWHRSAP